MARSWSASALWQTSVRTKPSAGLRPAAWSGLGYLRGGNSSGANAVNADGSVVVGGSTTANNVHNPEAFRWTQSGGMVGLGYLSGDNFSAAHAVNANGSVVVGCSGLNGNCGRAFLWTRSHRSARNT